MGRWTLAAVRRAPDIPLILDETSQGFTACMASLLGGTDLGVSRLQKKDWHWDARWNSQPVALCDEGAFQHLCCAFQHYHTAFRLERVFQLGLWCFSASCFSTQWDLKILKCSRMDSAWKVPDRTDTKKAPFNYNIQYFLDWILHGFMSCKLNLQLKQILKFLFNIPGAGDIEWLDKWYSWHFDLGLFFSASQHSNCFSGKYCLSAQKKTTKKRFHGVM